MEQIAIFCDMDDFRRHTSNIAKKLLMDKEELIPKAKMSLSEIMSTSSKAFILFIIFY